MFEKSKLKIKRKQLEKIKTEIIKEKKELEAIKMFLEDKSEKIDISNVYVFTYGGISYICELESNYKLSCYCNVFKDVFSKEKLFKVFSTNRLQNKVLMINSEYYNGKDKYAYVKPILDENHDLLKYVDRQVPSYVLQQYLYKLNNIYIDNSNFKKLKK